MTETDQDSIPPGQQTPAPPSDQRSVRSVLTDRRIGPTAVVAVAALIGLIVWLVVESGGDSSATKTTTQANPNPPVELSASGLLTLAKAVNDPIYWVGKRNNVVYELTRTGDRTYVRYLPTGLKAGDPKPYLTIGTYAMRNAYDVTKKSPGAFDVAGGGIAAVSPKHDTSVYVAFPKSNYQVEVYSPSASVARQFAESGKVKAVAGSGKSSSSAGRGPIAMTPDKLRSAAASIGYPIYWAGAREDTTYELTQTAAGRTYVRYLPSGVLVGDKKPYLTIGTYPLKNAYATTAAAGKEKGNVVIRLPNGGVAVYAKKNPRNVHLADRGSSVQVEVYDPSPKVPRNLVNSGLVAPVR